ncbi:hypothetical protein FF38_10247 [Lucilia cuprina]|uniref:Uncharacterized protein n=1 Tax=Lucilia cuprina TaxID=7375 RepID=A0A0L0CJT3_LUCCU|nr:hypothetical protein FF38_10247 [Lucilia cuprina]
MLINDVALFLVHKNKCIEVSKALLVTSTTSKEKYNSFVLMLVTHRNIGQTRLHILPLLWLGDCKRSMSLIFKRISLPDLYDISYEQIEISNGYLFFIIVMGIMAYFMHRQWRNYLLDLRCDTLEQEIVYTDSKEMKDAKIKLLQTINNIIERKTNFGKCLKEIDKNEENLCATDNYGDFLQDFNN